MSPPSDDSPQARARPRFGLVLKITVAFGLTFVVLEATLLIAGHAYWRDLLKSQIEAHLSAVAASRREMVDLGIRILRQQATLSSQRAEYRRVLGEGAASPTASTDPVNALKALQRLVDGKTVYAASLVDAKGTVVLANKPEDVGRDLSDAPEVKSGLEGAYLGLPRRVNDHFETMVAAPIVNRKIPVGVLLLRVDAAPLVDAVRDRSGLGEHGEVMIVVRRGDQIRYVLPPRGSPQLAGTSVSASKDLATTIAGKGTFLRQRDYRGATVLAAGSPTDYFGWAIVAKMDEAEAYAPIYQASRARAIYGTLVAAAGTLAGYLLARRFTRPVRQLSEAAVRVARGDYSGAVPVNAHDEIGALSGTFNEMLAAIRARGAQRDQAEAALRHADQRKDDFLAILGHELRNPVAAIAAGMLVWREEPEDRDTATMVRAVIERQINHLKRLVDDLLDVARITTGKIELRKQPVKVNDLVAHAVNSAKPFIEARHHRLHLPAPEREVWINADSTRIEQVLTNLLTNAAKYTEDGGEISVSQRVEGDNVVISVCDNGIGIAPGVVAKIFDLFTQGDSSLDRRFGGLGIGLSLSRELVGLHGGIISAHSDGVGCGAQFRVRLPVIEAPERQEVAAPAPPVALPITPRRILLVDDNADSTRLLCQLFERRGHHVRVAYDGRVGLETAREFNPEVLILDIGLPGLDGYELARQLRAGGFSRALMIALSGYAQESDLAQADQAGFDHHFAKPVDFDELAALVASAPAANGSGIN